MSMVSGSDCPFSQSRECRWWGQRESADTAFLIAPSDPVLEPLRLLAIEVAEKFVAECVQAIDTPPTNEDIWCENICREILRCQFVLVILDESSWRRENCGLPPGWEIKERNANVYFEYGLAMGAKKRAVCLLQQGTDLPFDTGWLSILYYSPDALNGESGTREELKDKLAESIESIYPRLTPDEAEKAFDRLWKFYVGGSKRRLHKVIRHGRNLLQEQGLKAWPRASAALRTHPEVQSRIEKGVRVILAHTTRGYNSSQVPDYVDVCIVEGSYLYLVSLIESWESGKSGFGPEDIPGLLEGADARDDLIPCRRDWSFAEPVAPDISELQGSN